MGAHPVELLGGRRTVVVADLVRTNRRRADERCNVGGDATRRKLVEVLAERRPRDVELDVALPRFHVPLHLIAERAHGAFAEHRERHPLANAAL